jgi:hypothetical protein
MVISCNNLTVQFVRATCMPSSINYYNYLLERRSHKTPSAVQMWHEQKIWRFIQGSKRKLNLLSRCKQEVQVASLDLSIGGRLFLGRAEASHLEILSHTLAMPKYVLVNKLTTSFVCNHWQSLSPREIRHKVHRSKLIPIPCIYVWACQDLSWSLRKFEQTPVPKS